MGISWEILANFHQIEVDFSRYGAKYSANLMLKYLEQNLAVNRHVTIALEFTERELKLVDPKISV